MKAKRDDAAERGGGVPAGRPGYAVNRDRAETDSEREQAVIRVVITGVAAAYMAALPLFGSAFPARAFLLAGSYLLFSSALLAVILLRPGIHPSRRFLGIVGDISATTLAMHLSGSGGAPFFVILLWVTFGNGFRFGRTYIRVSAVLAVGGFSLVFAFTPFWRSLPTVSAALFIGLLVLPLYVDFLLKKLNAARERTEEASREKSRFLANMSHEIRTPLHGILGEAYLMRKTDLSADQSRILGSLETSAAVLSALVADILDFSRIEAGKVSIEAEDFRPRDLVESARAIVALDAEAKGLALEVAVDDSVPAVVRGDSHRVRQVLLNLLSNAVKFTERGSVAVRMETAECGDGRAMLRFEVVDTGIGISPDRQHRIFDPFIQADDTITRRYGGTGLGTAIAKQLVELMGGGIGFRSRPGEGSAFWFSVPVAPAASGAAVTTDEFAAVRPPGTAGACPPRRILVVEDNPVNRDLIRRILEQAGHVVRLAENGREALEVLDREPFDVVLMDLQMPEMGGEEALRLWRERSGGAGPRVVALTADATPETRMRCEAAGFYAFLTKPLDIPHLMSLLSAVSAETARGPGAEGAGPESGTPPAAPDPRYAPGENEPPVDTGVFRDFEDAGLTKETVAGLVRTFLRTSQATVDSLAAAVRDGDAERFHRLAHTLKGSAGQFGAMPLMRLCDACSRITPEEFRREGNARLDALSLEHGRAREGLSALITP